MVSTIEVFLCYAHEDELLLNKLKTHLRPLQQEGLINIWHDRAIGAGTEWEREIDIHLGTAQIILLLVSPDFISSDYCYGIEIERALERHEAREARVIPVILRPVDWHSPRDAQRDTPLKQSGSRSFFVAAMGTALNRTSTLSQANCVAQDSYTVRLLISRCASRGV